MSIKDKLISDWKEVLSDFNCDACEEAVEQLLANESIAIVDRDAELPEMPKNIHTISGRRAYLRAQDDMEGWIKEIKE